MMLQKLQKLQMQMNKLREDGTFLKICYFLTDYYTQVSGSNDDVYSVLELKNW